MKRHLFIVALAVFATTSCSESPEPQEMAGTEVSEVSTISQTYTLNHTETVLKWHGEENEQHFHEGTINFSEGELTTVDGFINNGTFKVDLNSIIVTDEVTGEENKPSLISKLQSDSFFFMEEHPTFDITVSEIKDGSLPLTITVLGSEVSTDVKVDVNESESGLSVMGDFSIDLAPAAVPGLQVDENGEGISSVVDFSLNLVMDKK